MRVYAANAAIATRSLRLTTESGPAVAADILDVTSSPFDHVVRSLADLPAPSGGYIYLTTGSWAFAAALNIGANRLRVPGTAGCFLQGFGYTVTSSASPALRIEGIASLLGMTIQSTTGAGIVVAGGARANLYAGTEVIAATYALNPEGAASVTASDCVFSTTSAAGTAVRIAGASRVQITGGRWTGAGGTGVGMLVAGDVPTIQLSGIRTSTLPTFVSYSSGSVGVALINGCRTDATTGIDWPFLTVPTQGLAIVGNSLDCLNPFVGFAVTDPRVNAKANIGSAGLLSETPTVP